MGSGVIIVVGLGLNGAIWIWPQKTNILFLIVSWKPKTTATAIIIMATLNAVAAVARRIMNLEKEALLLFVMRLAMNRESCTG